MRRLLSVFVLLIPCGISQAQLRPDIVAVPQGMDLRGRIMPIRFILDKTVQRLGSITFICDTSAFSLFFVSEELGGPMLHPGEILSAQSPVFSDRAGPGTDPVKKIFIRGQGFVAGFDQINASGPGEIASLSIFQNTDLIGQDYYNTKEVQLLFGITASDTDGIPMKLTLEPHPLHIPADLRLFGDVNRDGKFDLGDVILCLRRVVGLMDLDEASLYYADLFPASKTGVLMPNGRLIGDGVVTSADVIQMLRIVTGYWKYWWPDAR
jgi:hypothetical protein